MRRLCLAPQRAHGREVVVGDAPALGEGHAHRAHLRLAPADAQPEDEPAIREHVQGRELLGEHHGLALGQDDDARGEQDARGVGGEEGQGHDGLEQPHVGGHGTSGHGRIRKHHVVGDPERLEAGGLGGPAEARGGVGVPAAVQVDGMESEFHRRFSLMPGIGVGDYIASMASRRTRTWPGSLAPCCSHPLCRPRSRSRSSIQRSPRSPHQCTS